MPDQPADEVPDQPAPPPVAMGIEATVQFFPTPGDVRFQRHTVNGVDCVVVLMIKQDGVKTHFFTVDEFRAKLTEGHTLVGGIEVPSPDAVAKLFVAGDGR